MREPAGEKREEDVEEFMRVHARGHTAVLG